MYTTCVSHVHNIQKKALDSLGLELQVVVSFHVGVGNQTWVQQEQQVLFATAPSSQPQFSSF